MTVSPDQTPGTAGGFSFQLETENGRLQLRALHRPDYGPIYADWQSAEMVSRIRAGKKQLLARACGLHKRAGLSILDGTAGLGRDGYTLSQLGAEVTLCERHPQIAALLRDAQQRSGDTRIQLRECSTRELLQPPQQWDVIYLDPMYPEAGRRALPQKEMQIFRDLTGGDADADSLLEPAIACARSRVVVKRPRHAPPLQGRDPSLQMEGNQARFDLYLIG